MAKAQPQPEKESGIEIQLQVYQGTEVEKLFKLCAGRPAGNYETPVLNGHTGADFRVLHSLVSRNAVRPSYVDPLVRPSAALAEDPHPEVPKVPGRPVSTYVVSSQWVGNDDVAALSNATAPDQGGSLWSVQVKKNGRIEHACVAGLQTRTACKL